MKKLFQMRKNICRRVILVLVAILLCGCGRNEGAEIPSVQQPEIDITEELPTSAPEITLPTNTPAISLPTQEKEQDILPTSNDELYYYLMEQWKTGELPGIYSYASDELKTLVDEEQFSSMFLNLNETFGHIVRIENEKSIKDIMIYYLKNLLSNYHTISSIKVGFYFENLKMQCSLNYLNYTFSFQITKEVYYE